MKRAWLLSLLVVGIAVFVALMVSNRNAVSAEFKVIGKTNLQVVPPEPPTFRKTDIVQASCLTEGTFFEERVCCQKIKNQPVSVSACVEPSDQYSAHTIGEQYLYYEASSGLWREASFSCPESVVFGKSGNTRLVHLIICLGVSPDTNTGGTSQPGDTTNSSTSSDTPNNN